MFPRIVVVKINKWHFVKGTNNFKISLAAILIMFYTLRTMLLYCLKPVENQNNYLGNDRRKKERRKEIRFL